MTNFDIPELTESLSNLKHKKFHNDDGSVTYYIYYNSILNGGLSSGKVSLRISESDDNYNKYLIKCESLDGSYRIVGLGSKISVQNSRNTLRVTLDDGEDIDLLINKLEEFSAFHKYN